RSVEPRGSTRRRGLHKRWLGSAQYGLVSAAVKPDIPRRVCLMLRLRALPQGSLSREGQRLRRYRSHREIADVFGGRCDGDHKIAGYRAPAQSLFFRPAAGEVCGGGGPAFFPGGLLGGVGAGVKRGGAQNVGRIPVCRGSLWCPAFLRLSPVWSFALCRTMT